MAAALMIFSLPVLADQGTMGKYAERGAGAELVNIGAINHEGGGNGGSNGGFSCFPFICN
jgi:hypothetical protein